MTNLPLHVFNLHTLVNASMSTNVTSDVVSLNTVSGCAVDAIITENSSLDGSLILEGSNNQSGTFTSIKTFTVNDQSDSYLINIENPQYGFIRIRYVSTGGSGTLNVYVNGKRR